MTINTQKLRDLIRQACPLPWMLATSNSWRRIVDPYHVPVCSPCNQPDGHPDLAFPGGAEGATATLLIEAVNALPELLSDYDRLRDALRRLEKGFKAGRDNANAMFRESGNVYHEGRRTAYDQAASDVRAALAQEQGGSDGN